MEATTEGGLQAPARGGAGAGEGAPGATPQPRSTTTDPGSGAADPDSNLEVIARTRAFILLRFTLIVATASLLLAEVGPSGFLWVPLALFSAALLSNVVAVLLPPTFTEQPFFTTAVVIGDTAWITIALLATGKFTADFFYLYFFVLFLAAMGENLRLIVLGAVVVCSAYVVTVLATGSALRVLETSFLIRLPFLFAVAIFYGYLVDRLRREKQRAQGERLVIEGLRSSRNALEEANRALQSEIRVREAAQEELRAANERLQELSDVKSRFFTTVSHEVKTPLTAIKNALSLIRSQRDPGAERQLLDMVQRNADRLNLIISDMLDMSRVESGVLRIRAESVRLSDLVPPILQSLRAKADDADVELALEVPASLPAVWADRRRVQQVVTDLVTNAIRATARDGKVTVGARHVGGRIEVSVEDTGIGLTPEEQRRVFEPFCQVGNSLVGRSPGTGLGLTISRDVCRGHGCELKVESAPGVGSRFSFVLPVDSPRATEVLEFEDAMRSTYRRYPYFSLLVVTQPPPGGGRTDGEHWAPVLGQLRERLKKVLPRAHDRFVLQPAHGRLVVVLLATPRDGGRMVRSRMEEALTADPAVLEGQPLAPPRVAGPSCYPDDGLFGARLIEVALASAEGRLPVEEVS